MVITALVPDCLSWLALSVCDVVALMDRVLNNWKPIDMAPKNGQPLWLVEDGAPLGLTIPHQCAGYWTPNRHYKAGGFWQSVDSGNIIDPTHWMPLPKPPRIRR